MTSFERIFTGLCILFSGIIIIGNLTYQKFVILNFLPFHVFELSVGAILYPLTFLITDLITEFFGKEKARSCVRFAISMNILAALIVGFMDNLTATPWSKINDETFHAVFGAYGIAILGSMVACYAAQKIDIFLYLWIRQLTDGKQLWLRNNGSTAISLFIDTSVVIGIFTIFGIVSIENMGSLILNSYMFKLFFTIFSTPLFYLCFHGIKFILKSNTSINQFGRDGEKVTAI